MRRLLYLCVLVLCAVRTASAQSVTSYSGGMVAEEGAWCWFADPRALHYQNEAGTINATYIGYIDVHGNVKATQYDWVNHRKTDVLVRSYFQPDDHNNPTFVVLPDERVMIFYTRHTDEPKIWYRISVRPGDISQLGDEKYLATQNNTTYPSPFILSDDPNHIYLCWRGINWHPTIARITMPDAQDNCSFDFGPKQIVQSTGARPYAKYQSNGKDKIYVSYTTGHPDNEMPDWLYFNVIDINKGNGPVLRDLNGKQLSVIADGTFKVNKTDAYAQSYPVTIVDKTAGVRNWVWQIALDANEHPVIAYPHIDNDKTSHTYWYARWTGTEWRNTWVAYAGHAFHQNWNSTERCYSGGMALDPDHINDLYLSIPTKDGAYNKDGVYEIWKYTIDDEGKVQDNPVQVTTNSAKNNARPFVIPGSKDSKMRLAWMNGDYYYWIVKQGYPLGYPTSIRADYDWQEAVGELAELDCVCLGQNQTLNVVMAMDEANYKGTLFSLANGISYSLGDDQYPVLTVGGKSYKSQNRLLTSDNWATGSTGTSGDNHPTKVTTWVLTLTYDGQQLVTYRNGLVDQVIACEGLETGSLEVPEGSTHKVISANSYGGALTPVAVQQVVQQAQAALKAELARTALSTITLPANVHADLPLPTVVLGLTVTWSSSRTDVMSDGGLVTHPAESTDVELTATCEGEIRPFTLTVLPRDINLANRCEVLNLDLTGNATNAFDTNTFGQVPEGLLSQLRSYTVLLTATAQSLAKAPRFYDFGSASGNSLFLRANPLSAGVKYNGGTTTMVNASTQLTTGVEYKLAVSYNAATGITRIYINGREDASGIENQVAPYELAQVAADTRNYIGRTQWWDTQYKGDNQDFQGTISELRVYDICLTQEEICELQEVNPEVKPLPSALVNGDFEGSYSVQSGSGVSSDRAIYVPEGWKVNRKDGNNNDLTALKAGDLYYSNFFASLPKPDSEGKQTYWIRQNWGTPTLILSQELRLPQGQYTLDAQVWQSGNGGQAAVAVVSEQGSTLRSSALSSKESWQDVSLQFECDGQASTTIQLIAEHTANQNTQIIGFDNIVITGRPTGMTPAKVTQPARSGEVYDLSGRKVTRMQKNNIYIQPNGKLLYR